MATSVRVIPLHAVATVATVRPLPHASIAKSRSLFGAASPVRPFVSTSFRLEHGSHSQLESSPSVSQNHLTPATPQTLTEKIVQQYAVGLPRGKKVRAGDYVTLAPQHVMTHDNSHPVAMKFMEMGGTKVYNNRQLVTCIDHDTQNKTEPYIKKIRQIQEFAAKHDIPFYPPGRGIGHQIMVEEGYAWPGTVAVASDSHSNIYGGVACLGTPVVRTDAASIWATGQTWWQHPPVAKITFTGILPPGVSGKDVIVALCGLFNQDEVLNHAIEFAGSEQTMASIPIGDRLTIANMTTEWGALSGLFPVDETLVSWYRAKATTAAILDNATEHRINHERIDKIAENRLNADPGAVYAKEFYLSLSTLSPFVAGPNSVKIATPVMKLEAENIPINKAYLVSCTNARASDFARAARVFREAAQDNKPAKIAPGVDLYIAAASTVEQEIAEEAGDWQLLLDAGAQPLPSGCGPCIGLGTGLLEPGEVGISASNRNFKGRMGSTDAKAYLASPEIVAASALHGRISGPGWYQKPEGIEKVIIGEGSGDLIADQAVAVGDALQNFINQAENLMATSEWADKQSSLSVPVENETLTDIFPGFPEKIEGEIIFCDNDNINTDGIYPGKYTYNDVTTEKMAAVCMENYDLEFRTTAKSGDILVAGYCFGVGSSREQAATAILAKQIPLVVAGSFSNIFGRNSINNALPVLESPRLVQRLREIYKHETKKMLTRRTGWKLLWDVRRSKIIVTENDGSIWEEKVSEIPATVQEVMAKGGLEKWVKSKIENSE